MTSKSSTFFLFSANIYHYKGPRQTKLSGVIPCQKFFVEPVLITTFVLSGRFYNRSKKRRDTAVDDHCYGRRLFKCYNDTAVDRIWRLHAVC